MEILRKCCYHIYGVTIGPTYFALHCQLRNSIYCPFGYERVYLSLCKVADHGSATVRPTAPSVRHPFPDFGSHFTEDFQAHLTPFQVHEMHAMLRNWSDVFAQHGVGQATGVKHHFRLTDNTSFKEGSRRISPHIVEDVPSYEEMLNMRLIRHSKSPHAYNAVLVHRKDDKLIIYREICIA